MENIISYYLAFWVYPGNNLAQANVLKIVLKIEIKPPYLHSTYLNIIGPKIIGPHLLENSNPAGHTSYSRSFKQEPGQLKCPSCPLSFDRTQLLKEHMTSVHNSMPSFSVQSQPIQLGQQLVFQSPSQNQPKSFETPNTPDGLYCNQCKNPFANKYRCEIFGFFSYRSLKMREKIY